MQADGITATNNQIIHSKAVLGDLIIGCPFILL